MVKVCQQDVLLSEHF